LRGLRAQKTGERVTVRPTTKQELAETLRSANRPGGILPRIELTSLNRLLHHTPEDMTAKAEAGMTVAALQEQLGRAGQWLPIDPPAPDQLSLAALLSDNASGPRRFGYGTIRDHVIGLQVVLADGRLVSSGGNVVKNVAGFDLMKLFIGARQSLGIPVEVTFKLLPRPETEVFLEARAADAAHADQLTVAVLESELTPVVLDWHRMPTAHAKPGEITVVLGFAGMREQVQWQETRAAQLGFRERTDLGYAARFWAEHGEGSECTSVLPSKLPTLVPQLASVPFVARAGNGVVYHAGGSHPAGARDPDELSRRIKDCFDPHHVLPAIPLGRTRSA
jgi:glycolate oxidase FAD binding subunit